MTEEAILQLTKKLLDQVVAEQHKQSIILTSLQNKTETNYHTLSSLYKLILGGNGTPSLITKHELLEQKYNHLHNDINKIYSKDSVKKEHAWDIRVALFCSITAIIVVITQVILEFLL